VFDFLKKQKKIEHDNLSYIVFNFKKFHRIGQIENQKSGQKLKFLSLIKTHDNFLFFV
jgi:hypothetical protein